jgi:hypothetical protein
MRRAFLGESGCAVSRLAMGTQDIRLGRGRNDRMGREERWDDLPEQLEESLGSVDWELGEEEAGMLDAASAVPLPYPYRFIERYTRRRGE